MHTYIYIYINLKYKCIYVHIFMYIYVNINFSCYICILYIHQHVRLTFCILSKRLPSEIGHLLSLLLLLFVEMSSDFWLLAEVLFLFSVFGIESVFLFVTSTNSVLCLTQRGWDEFKLSLCNLKSVLFVT